MEKPENALRRKTRDRQTAFKIIYFKIIICIKAGTCINEKKPRFKHCV